MIELEGDVKDMEREGEGGNVRKKEVIINLFQ